MSFNDDEPIVPPPNSGPRPTPIVTGRVLLLCKNNSKVPLEKNRQKAIVELTGGDSTSDRAGLDLVAVLDVSGSMDRDGMIGKMKTAMQFVIKKLSPMDRLSIVTFSSAATRLCPLRQVTDASQPEMEALIDGLRAGGGTNISDGLSTGLKVLADRKLSGGRVVGVMLMSDGDQNYGDAAEVAIGNVPVYTFGFGANYDARTLNAVAKNSKGGTFSFVSDIKNLSMAFSQCLAGLITVVVQNLTLTVGSEESTIEKVESGSYPQDADADAGEIIVSFGYLYSQEVRKVLVELELPKIDRRRGSDILRFTYTYNTDHEALYEAPPAMLSALRTDKLTQEDDRMVRELEAEEARLKTVAMIKVARTMADNKNIGDARDKLVEAKNALELVVEQSSPLVDNLKTELKQLLELMKSQELYEKEGRSYALSSETSHDLQRFAARGDIEGMRLFATPRMDAYLEQAKRFDQDPTAPVPSVDEDVKEEIANKPPAPIAGPITILTSITFVIQAAIQALQTFWNFITGRL